MINLTPMTTKYEYTVVVLQMDKKTFATSRSGILQGLVPKSAQEMSELGDSGWELVSVMPYITGGPFLAGDPGTDAALGFFKRAK